MKVVMEIWIIYQRFGVMISPDIWEVTIPTPEIYLNRAWSTDLLPNRCHKE